MLDAAIEAFKSSISPPDSRVSQLPQIVLVFGGSLGADPYTSSRQLFLNWMLAKSHPISSLIRTPEQFSDWSQYEGYGNLIDFESDAGNLSRVVVLFSEGPGAFAELGAFCMDPVLSERLFVVIEKRHYKDSSFIAHGPIKKIEHQNEDAICVVNSILPQDIEAELPDIADVLTAKMKSAPKTQAFDPTRPRDQFLLVADLVELFGALTKHELMVLLDFMGVEIAPKMFARIVNQLCRFELIELVEQTNKRFFVPPKERRWYFDYEALAGGSAFQRSRFKLQVFSALKGDKARFNAYSEIHSGK